MKKYIFIPALFLIWQATAVFGQSIDGNSNVFAFNNYKFELIEKDGKCVLNYTRTGKTSSLNLDLSANCQVVRDNKAKVRSFTYKDINAKVFLIAGKLGSDSVEKNKCGEEMQVILLKKGKIVSGKSQSGKVCTQYGADEKVFWLLSH
jgi:hypothetical protein